MKKFYQNILASKDVAEAVTAGRDFLGREFMIEDETYINNYFGSPVLFITTNEPIRLLKPATPQQPEEKPTEEKSSVTHTLRPSDFINDSRVRAGEKAGETQIANAGNTSERPTQNQRIDKNLTGTQLQSN
ncbi:MAG: hypothetical protein WKG06_34225 [Segetibacter sp.]